jgi:predicted negative regulator of RcsB-dependent stress response
MKNWLVVWMVLHCSLSWATTTYIEYTPEARVAYDHIMELRFDAAEVQINAIKGKQANNLVVDHLENYLDFLKVYIAEDEAAFQQAEVRKNARLARIEKSDPNNPYHLYLQADIRLQWAIARIKFEEWFGAFRDINQAFKLLEENTRRYPDFMPNKKNLGVLHAIVSALPSSVELVSSLEGDFQKGTRELREVLAYAKQNDFIFERETYILYAYVLLQFGDNANEAWRVLQRSSIRNNADPAATFILSTVAMKSGRNDQAITLLQNRPKATDFYPFPYLNFMLGKAKLHRLDKDAATYFKKYLANFKGRNYIKESYRLLAWHELVQGNQAGYTNYISKVKKYGYTQIGADESALTEANSGVIPNVTVLKARLLFDGAYFERAYSLLNKQSASDFQAQKTILEYHYFLGRCTHSLKRYDEALQHYATVIQKGETASWYYACRAALESGHIYERLNETVAARNAYERCLSIRPKEHRYSLHQQAKAGLGRL